MSLLAVLLASYLLILLVLFIYGNNCLMLAYLHRKRKKEKTPLLSDYPMVTVQLPVYNELYVVERLIRKVAEMDYPKDKMEIQVLDDSTDETTGVTEKCVDELRCKGYSVELLHRVKRDGYKAGALREGLKYAKGEFIAVFDADFLPDKNFLKRCLPYFSDPSVGMVQTRWGHVNEDYSLLTRALSIGIDGHFQIEQSTRYSAGLFLNFNGTAGVWRRQCILDSGGWQDDTLTEDLDLSYRAQLRGWRLVFLDDVVSPAEVPVQINAFKRQQFRWAKGSIQCAKKLLPRVARAKIPAFKKMEALLHLTYYSVHPMMVALLLLTLPLIFLSNSSLFVFRFFALGTFGPLAMYALSQKELYEGWKSRLKYLPMLTVLGVGISVNNTRAVFEALLNKGGVFQRTPKFGIERSSDKWDEKKYRLSFPFVTLIEVALGMYALAALYYAFVTSNFFLVPFLALYAFGYFYVSGLTIAHSFPRLKMPRLPTMCLAGIFVIAALLRLYRATMGDLSEDPYHHWLVSSYLAYGGNYDDILGAMELHLPGYHVFASGIVLALGRDILWLKLANILLSLGSIYLAYLIAGRYSVKAGLLAAAFLALNPFEILVSSTSYTEPLAVFAFLLAVYLIEQGKEKAASIALLLGSATRYEVWLALPFLKKRLILPSLAFILAWTAFNGFFFGSILLRSREVLDFEITSGAVQAGALLRTFDILKYFFIASPLVYSLGIYFAVKNIRKNLPAFSLFNLALVFLATASGIMAGSFRYFSLAIPLLCIFTGIQLRDSRKLACVVLASLVIVLPFYFNLYSSLDALYRPSMRAGEFAGSSGAGVILSNSPVPLYYSGLPAEKLLIPEMLKGIKQENAVEFLKEQGVDYIIYVDSPLSELDRLLSGVGGGGNTPELALAYDPNGWEQKYGAKKAYVYRLRSDGVFKTTGSYISSSPLMVDMDGDGFDEIIAASDKLYIWKSNGSLLPGFPAETEGLIASTPSIGYTKSGSVIFVGSDDNKLYAWWYNGSSLSGFPKTTNGDVFSRPLPVDMDGDGSSEAIAGSDDGYVYAWHMNGSPVTGWPVKTQGYVSSSPAAADIDGDGEAEIFAGSWDENLYAWHANGSLLAGFPLETGSAVWATPRIADLDGDGSLDIIAASDMVYAWDRHGKMLPGLPVRSKSYIVSSPLVQDIDNDGMLEIVVASDSLYVYDSNGILKQAPVHTGYYFWASPFSGDLDSDGILEIVIGDWSGNVYAFKPDGSILRGFPKITQGRIFASAAVKDIDKDGTMEVLAGSWDKNIYLWSIDSNGSYRMEDREIVRAEDGFPLLNNISFKQENNVRFLYANLSGNVERPLLNYYGDDNTWHPSPMVLSEGMHVGMIAPQRQKEVKYYITLESGNNSYRFPEEGSYEFKN